ncbi:MAG: 2,3-bisphosphoglycerate-independent phosphoglycerate mutase [Planctomycetes bacterium]|jgi:2,3-bisphosphoglycerate-independent phosphoglycerate mutase|nr:2,3-bisphosphoglycerate-independent phosphoglycerate mutase [Planctomycetota bacterium]
MTARPKPVVLIVRDGWGRNPHPEHDDFNAVKLANTPRGEELLARYPHTLIATSGEDVGLNDGTMGNSEVGHQNIGAGRIVDQESMRITRAIRDGSFFENEALGRAIDQAIENDGDVHLLGIVSDAGVHGLLTHLYACLELGKRKGLGEDQMLIHCLTDGRDTGPFTGKGFIEQVEAKCDELGIGRIVSVIGRYYAMDRDNRWERVKQAYDLLTGGSSGGEGAPEVFNSAPAAVQAYYDQPTNDSQQGDEFITPRYVGKDHADTRISDGDSVILVNYRGDRPRELTRAFMQGEFFGHVPPSPDSGAEGFERPRKLDIQYVCMTAYDQTFAEWPNLGIAFTKPPKMTDIGGDYLAQQGLTQFRCAETEKFPHVTFFFNDYREEPFDGEHRQMAQSPKVATYDLQPEMSAPEVRDIVLGRINADDGEDVIIVNFANGDMVGHTGKLDAAIKAVETVDDCVGQIVDRVLENGGKLIVTADHGNAEQMFDPDTGSPHTAHTLYPVECIIVDPDLTADTKLRDDGRLADVFPTMLTLLGLDQPEAMTGTSLLQPVTA